MNIFLAAIVGLNVGMGAYYAQVGYPGAAFNFGVAAFVFYLGII